MSLRLRHFLLVGEATQTPWSLSLLEALAPLGDLQLVTKVEAAQVLSRDRYDVVIVDAGAISDIRDLVDRLRRQKPNVRIVVASASPTWRQSREVLLAGAVDYIHKSLDQRKLRARIQGVLDRPTS